MSLYVACYDIASDSRRARVADLLKSYGRRVQFSVFEIDVDPDEFEELRFQIGLLLARSDLFDFFPIDRRDPKRRVSWQRAPWPPDGVIVVGS